MRWRPHGIHCPFAAKRETQARRSACTADCVAGKAGSRPRRTGIPSCASANLLSTSPPSYGMQNQPRPWPARD
jgi:hypothetical protein